MKQLKTLILYALLCLANLANFVAQAQVAGSISVYPTASTLELPNTKQFIAYVPISPNTIVWLVNDIVGGNTNVGTISATGLYQPPAAIPSPSVITVKARSVAFPGASGAATITITKKYPYLWSVAPAQLQVGNYSVSLNGANFAPDSQAVVNGVDAVTQYVSPTKLVVSGNAAAIGTLQFAVRQPAPGAVTGNSVAAPVTPPLVSVAVSPASASMPLGTTQTFTSSVSGHANTAVTWTVNGFPGGSPAVGTITAAGAYSAPTNMPSPNTITLRATSVAVPSSFADATVTLTVPIVVAVSPATLTLQTCSTQTFAAVVTGTANTSVTWSVNGVNGGSTTFGTISSSGVYVAPSMVPAPSIVTVRATSVASASSFGKATVTLASKPYPTVSLSAARFLEQSSFGPTPATLAKVEQMGIEAYLDEQLAMDEIAVDDPAENSMGLLRNWALHNYTTAPDQLRQRVAFALSQIIVTSANKQIYPDAMMPWLRILNHHAFGNYSNLLHDVTVSPSMGKYLDLANSMKPGMAGGANENYPRELMQLFTIGLWQLNQDGSQTLDGNGKAIPAYDQETVREVALALTGWTFATAPGNTPHLANGEYFGAPMESRPQSHSTVAKNFLGWTLPAGQTVEQDLAGLLDCLMRHPNIAPFISTRLIRSLVMSNPSPGYIQRVAAVFADNGAGVRGDLKAVVKTILLDPEARQDVATQTQGRLKDSILHVAGFLRALDGHFTTDQQLTYLFDYMSQGVLTPPSVFSWFSPLYRVPKSPLFGPEFQIYSPTDAALRGNLFHFILNAASPDVPIDLSKFQQYGNDMPAMVEAANQALLYGRMPDGMKTAIANAAAPGYDARTRIETVLYLTALSGQYAVQH